MSSRSVVEIYLDGLLGRKIPFNDALKQAKADLGSRFPDIDLVISQIASERHEQIQNRTKLTEVGTARKLDILEYGWYSGVAKEDGVWARLKSNMESGPLREALPEIDKSTEEIVASIAEPHVVDDRRLGLVIGNVQSGKTANYSAVIAKALDSGYKFILVLSGLHNNLRSQTQRRLERDLGVTQDAEDWYRLTDHDNDFGRSHALNASSIVARSPYVLAVVKKNGGRLRNVLAFLRKLDDRTRKDTPFLVIDDESDQATPDSSANPDDDPTVINKLMREIWAEVRNGTYVGYTATPFANVFINPDPEEDLLPDLYPGDFINVMPTPPDYFGAERIFGLETDYTNISGPDVVRRIPSDDVTLLSPKGRDLSEVSVPVTNSLQDAIRWFIVAAAVRRMRGQHQAHSTMLIHTTHRVDPHFALQQAIVNYLEPIKRAAREDDVEAFKSIFHAEIDRAAELYGGVGRAPTWSNVRDEIPNVLRNLRVAVDNGRADMDQRLSYLDGPQTVIVIGGGTLSRGLTLEGLFVSYFTRTSNTYDTLLQMGRWFGYRPQYEDLQRIWLSPGLADDYRFLATVEDNLREDIKQMTVAGMTPNRIGVRVRQHPGRLQITSPAKMKYARQVEADFEGYRLQTTRFDVSNPDKINTNAKVVVDLLNSLHEYRHPAAKNLFQDVPVSKLSSFFNDFFVHDRFQGIFGDAFEWALEKLPNKTWNVVLPAVSDTEPGLSVGDLNYRTVNRTPLAAPDEDRQQSGEINIRALMSGRAKDIIWDLKLQKRLPRSLSESDVESLTNEAQYRLRRSREGADGRGLLAIYPINRKSAPSATSTLRQSMDSALRAVNPDLVSDDLSPLIGVALVAPFDTEGVVPTKGTYVAVKPAFEEDLDAEQESFVDNEGDYAGDPR